MYTIYLVSGTKPLVLESVLYNFANKKYCLQTDSKWLNLFTLYYPKSSCSSSLNIWMNDYLPKDNYYDIVICSLHPYFEEYSLVCSKVYPQNTQYFLKYN